ncbi:putative bifunctional diguanylate cyclase/phosphodiesterase [Marinospirillum alkaliphilum]|uniref:Diguanylate cyclase (GGDEF) domain-containing protein n=1 Tax=Marinospirillum alkaliphilum DSM 21637 TaxID=1122209 RepID=A0A1K1W9B3_9GAMM|nr:EAL domain-containing protein [Marinospirillum alkaliphilum]SFX33958.1 diguanylate cyclase (GGDEF) domain-containing protein [Marinospirillum alkaliphilum DSM 21637]
MSFYTCSPEATGADKDLVRFVEERGPQPLRPDLSAQSFKVLVVDDDEDVHLTTRLALKDLDFSGQQVSFLHAYSSGQAFAMLQAHPDTAVVLLDVVMESEQAGLQLVQRIRDELGLLSLRIILRTGQPGYAPQLDTIARYDINDYKTKGELTREKLFTVLMTALRSYNLLEQLQQLAYRDGLTGLLNRNGLLRDLEHHSCSNCESRGQPLQLALLDIDQFSMLNDTFGAEVGDQLLKTFALRLQQPGCLAAARLGSDHFAVLLSDHADRLLAAPALTAPLLLKGIEYGFSFCTGVATCSPGLSAAELMGYASVALKRAKRQGQGQRVIFTQQLVQDMRHHARLLRDLKQDLDSEGLFLEYQPQIDLRTGKLLGVEALVRWQQRNGQRVPPDQFIGLAEQSGLIIRLGDWVLRQALKDLQSLLQRVPGIRMAVNVSAVQFNQQDFEQKVEHCLLQQGLQGSYLDLEITESVGILGSDAVETKFHKLKDLGITLSIDDFGTGFSSLSYLERLSADRLKIDRSFVAKLDASASGQRIAQMIIGLGQRLNLQVLAEGIETESQLEQLKVMGCHEGQGYLIARPMCLNELEGWIDAWRQ